MPSKAINEYNPLVYWIATPLHKNFCFDRNALKVKFNLCLESITKVYSKMRVAKLKDKWNDSDGKLVMNNHLMADGAQMYWHAIDVAFAFNIAKRNDFLIRFAFDKLNRRKTGQKQGKKRNFRAVTQQSRVDRMNDDIQHFFERRRVNSSNQSRELVPEEADTENRRQRNNRFILPKPNPKYFRH